jgi:serine/threonine protein kinase
MTDLGLSGVVEADSTNVSLGEIMYGFVSYMPCKLMKMVYFYRCKITDFGLSRVLEADSAHVSLAENTYGTVSYMPRELLQDGKMTKQVDIYSFAIIMHELYTGQIVFRGMSATQVLPVSVCKHEYLYVCSLHRKCAAHPDLVTQLPTDARTLLHTCATLF